MKMIEIKNVTKIYKNTGTVALKNVSFSFPATGLFYLVGESGSGKSTLLHIMAGLENDYQGEVFYKEEKINSFSKKRLEEYLRKDVSVSLQSDVFDFDSDVMDNLLLPLEISALSKEEKNCRIKNVASDLNITNLLHAKISLLSGGELKRVNLARSLIKDCSVLLLDEPLGPLDQNMRVNFSRLFEHLGKSKLVIIITHNVGNILPGCNVLKMSDGKLFPEHLNNKKNIEKVECTQTVCKRKNSSFSRLLLNVIKMLKKRGRYSAFSIFASSLALFSIGLIIIISSGIGSGLIDYFSGSIERNSMLVQPKEEKIDSAMYSASSFRTAVRIKEKYSDYIFGLGTYYELNFEDTFANSDKVYFSSLSYDLNIYSLTGRSFSEFIYYQELDQSHGNFSNYKLSSDEIILGLAPNDLKSLFYFLNLGGNDYSLSINNYLIHTNLILHLDLANESIGYKLENLFEVKCVVPLKESRIIHTDQMFGENFIEEKMNFKIDDVLGGSKPNLWTVFKSYTLLTIPSKKREFLEKIGEDAEFRSIAFRQLKNELKKYYRKDDIMTSDRIMVLNECESHVYLSDIADIQNSYYSDIESICFSDGFYYYSDQGITSGFIRPLYVASDIELLNKIADYNYEAKFDLNGMQGSTILFDKGVVMGDLSRTQEKPLMFQSYIHPPKLKSGFVPKDFSQVIISSYLADMIFPNPSICIGKLLHVTCLASTIYKDGGYKNIFVDGTLRVTGIIEDDKCLIYQKPRFLAAFGEDQLGFSPSDRRIDKAIITFDSQKDPSAAMADLISKYPEYDFSFPSLEIAQSIDEIVFYINAGLSAFAVFTGIISALLMGIVIFLFIRKDNKRIKLMITMGYSTNDIANYYRLVGACLGILAYFSSSFSLLITNYSLDIGLKKELGLNIGSFSPSVFVVALFFSFLLIMMSNEIAILCIKKIKAHNGK